MTMPIETENAAPKGLNSLKQRAIAGAIWTFAGYGGAQLLRLTTNLVLTRLLAPEYFGVMALITVLLIGLAMFSDLGIGPNIMQSDHAEDQIFLDTAFTLQFIRGCCIWIACFVAAYPFAHIYNEPRFIWLVPVMGFTGVVSGLTSTKTATANRQLQLGRLTMIEIGTQAVTAGLTVVWAWYSPTIWALVIGTMAGTSLKVVASHLLLPGPNNRFRWDNSAATSLIHFGKWIFLGTVFSFASNSAGSLILGKLVSMTEVGIFSIAVTLSKVVEQAYEQLSGKVLLPVFVRIKHLSPHDLRAQLLRVRRGSMAVFLPPLWLMAIFGKNIIVILFDKRYHSGGWILQVFSTFSILSVINGTMSFNLAKGNSFLMMLLSVVRLVSYLGSMYLGWLLFGSTGVIFGMAAYLLPVYLVELWVQRSYGILMPMVDVSALAISATVITIGLKATGQI